eukprot:11864114-Alexandrium_andersonii.AAC.1
MQRQWSPIFQGNGDPIEVASKFVAEYKQFLPSHAPFEVPSITPQMVKACLRANAKGAHGPDCWVPGELASMPHTAVVWLTA